MKVKESATQVVNTSKRVLGNGEQFVQAVALLTVAGFSYWSLTQLQVHKGLYWVVLSALVIIGLRGAYELVKFLDKE